MALEIEKKYLVRYIPNIKPIEVREYLFQGYLKTGKDYEVRISNRLHLTTKRGFGLIREEHIYDISQEVYQALLPLTVGKQIEKSRYWYALGNGLMAELDIYLGKNEGVKTVEVEFSSKEEANKFIPHEWFGEDVSEKLEYKNSILAK